MSVAEIRKSAEARMVKSLDTLKTNLSKIRTGRAHAGILDHVQVEYYGSPVPISQVANLNLVDARTISVQPYEKSMAAPIEKAIRESDLGLNPMSMGDTIRVPMPALTEERRRDLTRSCAAKARMPRSPCATCAAKPTTRSRSWSRTRKSPRTTSVAPRTMSRS